MCTYRRWRLLILHFKYFYPKAFAYTYTTVFVGSRLLISSRQRPTVNEHKPTLLGSSNHSVLTINKWFSFYQYEGASTSLKYLSGLYSQVRDHNAIYLQKMFVDCAKILCDCKTAIMPDMLRQISLKRFIDFMEDEKCWKTQNSPLVCRLQNHDITLHQSWC